MIQSYRGITRTNHNNSVYSAFSRADTNGETCAQRTNVCRIYESWAGHKSFWEFGVICKILHDHQLITEHQTGNSHSNSHAPDNSVSCKVIMSQWLIRPGLIWFNETKDMPCVQLTPIFLFIVYLVNFWINLSNKSSSNNQISWTYQLMNKNNKETNCSMRYRNQRMM